MERFSKLGEFIAYATIAIAGVIIGSLFLRLRKASEAESVLDG
jgi:hypothetical protein